MRKLSVLAGAALIASCFATAAMAAPTTISFGSNAGNVGQTKLYGGLVTLDAFYVSKTDWANAGGITYNSANTNLWERNLAPNDIGVGICNPGEGSSACTTGGGYYNEISSNVNIDVMRISVAAGWQFVDMTLASVDPADRYQLFGSNSGSPDLASLSPDLFGNGGGGFNPNFSLASVSGFTYLYLTGGNPSGANDFLLQSISVVQPGGPGGQDIPVPEPASLALLGAGLLGLGLAQRRRSKI